MSFLDIFKSDVSKVEAEFQKVEQVAKADAEKVEALVSTDLQLAFNVAHQAALDANLTVDKLKTDLQAALVKATELHQAAITAAQAVQTKVEQDLVNIKAAINAHTADVNTLTAQITPTSTAQ